MQSDIRYVEVTLKYYDAEGKELPGRRHVVLDSFELKEHRPVQPVYGREGDPEVKGFEPAGPHTLSLSGVVVTND